MDMTIAKRADMQAIIPGDDAGQNVSDHEMQIDVRQGSDSSETPFCTICISNIDENKYLLKCTHSFHKPCLKEAILHGIHKCPNCRAPIPTYTLMTGCGYVKLVGRGIKRYLACCLYTNAEPHWGDIFLNALVSLLYVGLYISVGLAAAFLTPEIHMLPDTGEQMLKNVNYIYFGGIFVFNPLITALSRLTPCS